MKLRITLALCALVITLSLASGHVKQSGYHVISTTRVGGDGAFDYVYADSVSRKLYIARRGTPPRVTMFDLDTLTSAGQLPDTNARGEAVDQKSGHGFCSSKPVAMWDSKSLAPIKTIDVDGRPDGIMCDDFNDHIYVFSHSAPNATVIDASDGKVLGTIDLGGAPEQAASDGAGHVYVDLEDRDQVAVVDANTMQVTAHYGLDGKGGGPGGLAIDPKNILFVACHDPNTMVIMDATTGKVITSLPIGKGVDGAGFNPDTMEVFSSQGDATLTVIKENSPTDFAVEQTVTTAPGAKTMTIDAKTGDIYLITAQYGPRPASETRGRGPMIPGSFSIIKVGK